MQNFEPHKNLAEAIKHVITAIAIVVAGVWTLYNWNILFPKTRAEVLASAATLRTDVQGELLAEFGNGGDGIRYEQRDEMEARCKADNTLAFIRTAPVSINLELKNSTAIPIMSRFDVLELSSGRIPEEGVSLSKAIKGTVGPIETSRIAEISDEGFFIAGLQENRIEAGQTIRSSMLFNAEFPVTCGDYDLLVFFTAKVSLRGVNPATGVNIPDATASKVFVTACQVTLTYGAYCGIDSINAFGQ